MNYHMRGAVVVAFALAAALAPAAPQGWYQDLDEAIRAAKREGKPILADFSTSWCHNCRSLEENTLSDPQVTSRLSKYVKVYVDGDRQQQMVSNFGVEGFPTLVTISPEGYELNRSVGYVGASQLADTLDGGLQAVGPLKAEKKKPSEAVAASGPTDSIRKPAAEKADEAPRAVAEKREDGATKSAVEKDHEAQEAPRVASASREEATRKIADRSVMEAKEEPRVVAKATKSEPAKVARTPDREINYYTIMAQASTDARTPHIEMASNRPASTHFQSAVKTTINPPVVSKKYVEEVAETDDQDAQKAPGSKLLAADPVADQLPKPLLNAGKTREADVAGSVPPASEAVNEKATATPAKSTPAAKSGDAAPAPGKSGESAAAQKATDAASKPDVLKTVRKLQAMDGEEPETKPAAEPAKPAAEKTKSARMEPETEAPAKTPVAAKTEPAGEEKPKLAVRKSADTEAPKAEAETPAREKATPEADSAAAKPESEVPSGEDVQRWMKIGDEKLVAGYKKEAHAQYAKIVERDPKNTSGQTDLAFIKMVALMVDRDEEALRKQAYDKIKEFEARFPNSTNKDYYTVIRAMFAADMGRYTEAHSLLDDFPTRFPNSRYIEMAHETWQELPPAGRDRQESSTSKPSASATKKPEGQAARKSTTTSSGGSSKSTGKPATATKTSSPRPTD